MRITTSDGKELDVQVTLEMAQDVVATSPNPIERGLAMALAAALTELQKCREEKSQPRCTYCRLHIGEGQDVVARAGHLFHVMCAFRWAPGPAETDETETDHDFVPMPYTKTCWWRPPGGGGRCEHLHDSTIHRGTEAWKRLHAPVKHG